MSDSISMHKENIEPSVASVATDIMKDCQDECNCIPASFFVLGIGTLDCFFGSQDIRQQKE